MRAVRDGLPPEERARASEEIRARVLALPEVEVARAVLLFHSFGSEVDTSGIAQDLAGLGRALFVPVIDGSVLRPAGYVPGDPVVPSAMGVPEPAEHVLGEPRDVDLVIAPGLAFDRRGHRLGYGRGYFDRFLRALSPAAGRVGIGFHVQLVDRVPYGPGDARLSVVITDREVMRVVLEP
jgi:5-formyltetrahydrofolate cyclo-ligase